MKTRRDLLTGELQKFTFIFTAGQGGGGSGILSISMINLGGVWNLMTRWAAKAVKIISKSANRRFKKYRHTCWKRKEEEESVRNNFLTFKFYKMIKTNIWKISAKPPIFRFAISLIWLVRKWPCQHYFYYKINSQSFQVSWALKNLLWASWKFLVIELTIKLKVLCILKILDFHDKQSLLIHIFKK